MLLATYNYYVDWNGDGDFFDANEDISQYVLSSSWQYGCQNGPPEHAAAGSCSLKLDNSSSIFSSFNPASPLYGKIRPGLAIRITMTIPGGSTVTMFQGYMQSLVPTVGDLVSVSTADLTGYGVLAQFGDDSDIEVPLQENITTGAAIGLLLDQAGISAGNRALDAGQSTISKWWVRQGSSRLDAMRELEDEELGRIREGKDGKVVFEDRSHPFAAPRSSAAQSTYGTGILRPYNLQQQDPLPGIFNKVQSNVRTFNKSDADIILVTLADVPGGVAGTPPVVPPNGSLTLNVEYPTPAAPSNYIAVNSWGMVDLAANTEIDGTGDDITPHVTPSKTEYGPKLTLTFVNNYSAPAYLTVLRIHGTAIVESDPIPIKSDDTTSQSMYRVHAFPYPSRWITNLKDGQAKLDYIVARFKDPRPRLTFEVRANYDAAHLAEVQARDVSDRIRVTAGSDFGLFVDAEFIIDYIAHSVDSGRLHTMTVQCTIAPTLQLGPSGTDYDPKTIPQPTTGGVDPVPDDLWTRAVLRDGRILFACAADKWNAGIDKADFRCKRIPLGDTYPDTVDLRLASEGGSDFDPVGDPNCFMIENLAASQAGINYQLFFDKTTGRGRYYFAFRLQNASGWSVWSDGNDHPQYVNDYGDTESSVAADTGPPSDWTVQIVAGPKSGTCQVVATRPKTNGNRIFSVFFQIRVTTEGGGSWRAIDADAGAAETFFDGSAIEAIYDPIAGTITFPPGTDFSACAGQDIMLVADVRKSSFNLPYCFWCGFSPDRISGTQLVGLSNLTFAFQPDSGGANAGKYVGVRCKLVRPPWSFIDLYGRNSPNTDGYQALAGYDGVGEYWLLPEGADTQTLSFKSDPIAIPAGKTLADLQGTAFFWTTYSISNAGIYSANGVVGDTEDNVINLTYTSTITIDCKLGDIFYITLTGDANLAPLVNAKHGAPVILVVRQDAVGGHVLTYDNKYRVGDDVDDLAISKDPLGHDYLGFIYDGVDDRIDAVALVRGYVP